MSCSIRGEISNGIEKVSLKPIILPLTDTHFHVKLTDLMSKPLSSYRLNAGTIYMSKKVPFIIDTLNVSEIMSSNSSSIKPKLVTYLILTDMYLGRSTFMISSSFSSPSSIGNTKVKADPVIAWLSDTTISNSNSAV